LDNLEGKAYDYTKEDTLAPGNSEHDSASLQHRSYKIAGERQWADKFIDTVR